MLIPFSGAITKAVVEKGFAAAFANAQLTVNQLGKRPWNPTPGSDQEALSDMGRWIFGDDGTPAPVPAPRFQGESDHRNQLDKVRGKSILRINTLSRFYNARRLHVRYLGNAT